MDYFCFLQSQKSHTKEKMVSRLHRSSQTCLPAIFFLMLSYSIEHTECVPLTDLASRSEYRQGEIHHQFDPSLDMDSLQNIPLTGRNIFSIGASFQHILQSGQNLAPFLKGCSRSTVLLIALLCVIAIKCSMDAFISTPDMHLSRWYVGSSRKSVMGIIRRKRVFEGLDWDKVRNEPIICDSPRHTAFWNVDKMPTIAEEC